ncbi:MAG: two-component regulator propeller domain-containing protein [Bacteroidales bacterium]
MKCYLILLLFLVHMFPVSSDPVSEKTFYFRNYTNKNGLSHNTVYCSLQDRRGFLWFGTESGLNRFDGHAFTRYHNDSDQPKEHNLPSDHILNLMEDSSGMIWIFTAEGTCYYDYQTDSIHAFLSEEAHKVEYFGQAYEDKKNNIWFRENNRILKYNRTTGQKQLYDAMEYGFRSVTMTMREEGIPVFADIIALYEYNPVSDSFTRTQVISEEELRIHKHIQVIHHVPDGGYLIGTDKGLKIYYTGNHTIETIIPDIHVRNIMPYSNNLFFIASESGIYLYNLLDKSCVNIRKSLTNEYSLADNATYSLTKDNEGGVWIGSFFGGISYLPATYTPFNYYIGGKTHEGMLGNTIREICPDKYGNLWLGTEDNGINCFAPHTNRMVNYSVHNKENKLSASNIHGLMADGDTLWVGTFNKGIDLLHIPTGKIRKTLNQANTNNGLISDFVLCFHKMKTGEILIGTSMGVVAYNPASDRFSAWSDMQSMVRQIYEDKAGTIWIASMYGVFRYIPDTGSDLAKTRHYEASGEAPDKGPVSNNITSIFQDTKGRIWITTIGGISLFDEQKETFTHFTTQNGLPSNLLFRIEEDCDHLFWISTANGLVHFNPNDYTIQTFNNKDVLHEKQFNYSSSYKDKNGLIYMGTINGMLSFNPCEFKTDTFMPSLFITKIHIPKNRHDKTHSRVMTDASEKLELSHNMFPLTLSYIALSYTAPGEIRYAYKLDGVDKEWISMNNNKEVTFASLLPGKYLFRVRSTNSSGEWQENEKTLQILVKPPFWATNMAYAIYLILFGGSIFWLYRYKRGKLERSHFRKQKLFEIEKEKELYNEKMRFFTFITHEIRTPLTLINAPLEMILKSREEISSGLLKHLTSIERNTQRLLQLSNQLLDFQKTENQGFRLHLTKTDICSWSNSLIQSFLPEFEQENKTLSVSYVTDTLYAFVDREAYAKIFTNLLSNALKYSEKCVFVNIAYAADQSGTILLEVSNDGLLIPENEKDAIFEPFYRIKETSTVSGSGIGLSLARSLAETHGGLLTYQPTSDGLNRFVFALPAGMETSASGLDKEDTENMEVHPPSENRITILLVEDQPEMREFIRNELEEDYLILEAENGQKAIGILNTNQINLIISDVIMPVMDGFDLCNEVKNNVQYSHIPFILLTALNDNQSRLTGLNNGADAYLEKPFSVSILKAQIENLLNNRKLTYKSFSEKPYVPVSTLALSPMDDIFLQKINLFINDNLHKSELSVDMIASEMGMSNSSLYRKIKGISSLSPVDFVRIARLKKAVRLFQQGEKRINEVAFQVGFSSPAYFSNCFLKQYGYSPSEFIRKLHSKETSPEEFSA